MRPNLFGYERAIVSNVNGWNLPGNKSLRNSIKNILSDLNKFYLQSLIAAAAEKCSSI